MRNKFLFLIWPFVSVVKTIQSGFRHQSNKTILWWFCGFIGLNISLYSETSDLNRYRDDFLDFASKDFNFLLDYLDGFINFKADHYDIVNELVGYTLSRFTENPYILYLVFGLIFGYFYSSIVSRIGKFTIPLGAIEYLLIFSLLLIIPPVKGITQFRFYTASIIFVYAILSYVLDKNKKALFFIALALLTHVALILPVTGFVFYVLMRKLNVKVILFLLVIALFAGYGLAFLEPIIMALGGSAEAKYGSYNGEIADARFAATRDRVWYAAYFREIVMVALMLPLFQLFRTRGVFENKDNELLKLGLFMMIVTTLTINMWMYHRYFDLLALYLIFFITYSYFKYRDPILKKSIIIISPVLLLMIGINGMEVLNIQNPYFLINNIFTVWFFQDLPSLKSLFF